MLFFRKKKVEEIKVELEPSFSKVVPPGTIRVLVRVAGNSGSVLLQACPASGEKLPPGVKADFTPPSGIPPFASMMDISVSEKAPLGTNPILVVATASKVRVPVTFVIIVVK